MKLVRLYANKSSFREIEFNTVGLTLITGEKSIRDKDGVVSGTCNGVGKTTALRILNYCLASQSEKIFKKLDDKWIFFLEFELNGKVHLVERSSDNKHLALDEKETSEKALRSFFNTNGPFVLDKNIDGLSFRSLITRFIRMPSIDMHEDIISTHREQKHEAVLRSMYLLGADYLLANRKIQNRAKFNNKESILSAYKNDNSLRQKYNKGADINANLDWLKEQVAILTDQLENMNFFEAYDNIQHEIMIKERIIRNKEKKVSVYDYQLAGIAKSLEYTPDVSSDELMQFYKGLEALFRTESLYHFDKVEKFHKEMAYNRKLRLNAEITKIEAEKDSLQKEIENLSNECSKLESQIKDRHSTREFFTLSQKKADYIAEIERLEEYTTREKRIKQEQLTIKRDMMNDSLEAAEYIKTMPLEHQSQLFRSFYSHLYPDTPAGLSLDVNSRDNFTQFDLSVSAINNMSNGVGDAKILAFDWLLLTHGANHNLGFLWNDNILFANLDPDVRARWFNFIYSESIKTGKQFIATINTENFDSMEEYLNEGEYKKLQDSIVLRLSGDKDSNKLLGIFFDDK